MYMCIDERTRKRLENWQCKFFHKQTTESNKKQKKMKKKAYNRRNTIEKRKCAKNTIIWKHALPSSECTAYTCVCVWVCVFSDEVGWVH